MIDNKQFAYLSSVLYTAVISDVLDDLGYPGRVMNKRIKPLFRCKLMGRAFTVQTIGVNEKPEHPYQMLLKSLDDIQEGEIYVADASNSASGFWGELLSNCVRARGGRGAIVDGMSRDNEKVIDIGFPVFSCGPSPLDSKGRNEVTGYRVPIKCGDLVVNPGELIFADMDGIIVIPPEVEDEAIKKALDKVEGENVVRKAFTQGMKASEAFEKFGIL